MSAWIVAVVVGVTGTLIGAVFELPFAYLTYRRTVIERDSFALTIFLQASLWAWVGYGFLILGACPSDECVPALATQTLPFSTIFAAVALLWAVAGMRVVNRRWRQILLLGVVAMAGIYGSIALLYARLINGSQHPAGDVAGLLVTLLPVVTLFAVFGAACMLGRTQPET